MDRSQVIRTAILALGIGAIGYIMYKSPSRRKEKTKDDSDTVKETDPIKKAAVPKGHCDEETIIMNNPDVQKLSPKQWDGIIHEFRRRAKENEGVQVWEVSQFTDVFNNIGVYDSTIISSMYRLWDRDGDGYVNFSDFVNTITSYCFASDVERNKLIFEVMDTNRDNVISYAELLTVCSVVNALREMDSDEPVDVSSKRLCDDCFEVLKNHHDLGISQEKFLVTYPFLKENLDLIKPFAKSIVENDINVEGSQ